MTPIAAILLVCSHGDRDVAAAIHAAAVAQSVPVSLALAVGCVESGLRGANPLGVDLCYHSRKDRPDAATCIDIGVRSLRRRLDGCGGDERCAARRYNGTAGKVAYAAKVVRIARFVRGKGSKRP